MNTDIELNRKRTLLSFGPREHRSHYFCGMREINEDESLGDANLTILNNKSFERKFGQQSLFQDVPKSRHESKDYEIIVNEIVPNEFSKENGVKFMVDVSYHRMSGTPCRRFWSVDVVGIDREKNPFSETFFDLDEDGKEQGGYDQGYRLMFPNLPRTYGESKKYSISVYEKHKLADSNYRKVTSMEICFDFLESWEPPRNAQGKFYLDDFEMMTVEEIEEVSICSCGHRAFESKECEDGIPIVIKYYDYGS